LGIGFGDDIPGGRDCALRDSYSIIFSREDLILNVSLRLLVHFLNSSSCHGRSLPSSTSGARGIINHLKLTFVADKPLPPRMAYQELLMAAEVPAGYFS